MLHSALINVMVKAARRAGRSLNRDLGEVENLQVSLKGPANFVSLAAKRAEEMLYSDLASAWDIAAGEMIVREAGGSVSGFVCPDKALTSGFVVCGFEFVHGELVK